MDSSSLNREQLYDPIREQWVAATPEERVRQKWIVHMIAVLGFPKESFLVEKKLSHLPHLSSRKVADRRIDLLVYTTLGGRFEPLLLVECKAEEIEESAIAQLAGYNRQVQATYIALISNNQVRFGYRKSQDELYQFHDFLPSFQELKKWAF